MEFGAALGLEPWNVDLTAFVNLDTNPIDRARNILLQATRDHKADWLLMVDNDVWCAEGADLVRMIRDGHDRGAAIIGPPVMRRDRKSLMVYDENRIAMQPREVPREIITVTALGTSIFAVRPSKIRGAFQFCFSDGLSEDRYFCKRVLESGESILCDGRILTAHRERPSPIWSR